MPATKPVSPTYAKLDAKAKTAIKADPRFNKLTGCIQSVWQQIGSDVEACSAEMGERTTNAMRMESCLDADRMTTMLGKEGKAADDYAEELFKLYGYNAVSKFLLTQVSF